MKEQKNYPINEVVPFSDFKEMLELAVADVPEKIAFRYKEKKTVHDVTYAQFYEDTKQLGTALAAVGMADRHIAMIGANSYYWIMVYLTVLNSTGVYVPIDKDLPEDDMVNVVNEGDVGVLFYAKNLEPFIQKNKERMPAVQYFISIGGDADAAVETSPKFLRYEDLMVRGKALLADGDTRYTAMKVADDALKMLVFTSGTTGKAKGVMLSLHNLVSSVYYGLQISTVYTCCLSVLPYHHTYEAVCNLLVSLHKHSTICINESLRAVAENLQLYKPDYMMLVPLFVETLYKKIWANAEKTGKAGMLKKLIKTSNGMRKMGIDMRKKLFASVRNAAFGGNMIKIVCGGAPIRADIAAFFDAIGITLVNGYGITECSPLVSANRDYFNDYRTVGVKLPCVDIRIDEPNEDGEGEICVKGDIVMMGYYKNQAATEEVLIDGWFHTGDYGKINEKEQLLITGRKKNLIVLSNGKNIYPEELEERIGGDPLVGEVVVYAVRNQEGEEVALCAEIFPSAEDVEKQGVADLAEALKTVVRDACADLPSYKQISKVVIRDTEFEKTTSKKIRRVNLHTAET